jgi:hypothetical protein
VTDAMVTVPAYFDDTQRRTKMGKLPELRPKESSTSPRPQLGHGLGKLKLSVSRFMISRTLISHLEMNDGGLKFFPLQETRFSVAGS